MNTIIDCSGDKLSTDEIISIIRNGEKIKSLPSLKSIWPFRVQNESFSYYLQNDLIIKKTDIPITKFDLVLFILWFIIPFICVIIVAIINKSYKGYLYFAIATTLIVTMETIVAHLIMDFILIRFLLVIGNIFVGAFLGYPSEKIPDKYFNPTGVIAGGLAGFFSIAVLYSFSSLSITATIWQYALIYFGFCVIGLIVLFFKLKIAKRKKLSQPETV